jgi:hypothetical protein
MRRGKAAKAEGEPQERKEEGGHYETSIKHVSTVTTVEEFWDTYNFLVRPNDLPSTTDYHLFRQGIKPTWGEYYSILELLQQGYYTAISDHSLDADRGSSQHEGWQVDCATQERSR